MDQYLEATFQTTSPLKVHNRFIQVHVYSYEVSTEIVNG